MNASEKNEFMILRREWKAFTVVSIIISKPTQVRAGNVTSELAGRFAIQRGNPWVDLPLVGS